MDASRRFRPARKEDIPELIEIQGSHPALPQWNEEHFRHEIMSQRSRFIVLEEESQCVGYGGLLLIPPEAQVTVLAMRPDLKGRGLGRGLLKHLLADALARACVTVTLEVSAGNAAAKSLYLSEGFLVVGRRLKFYNDGSDAVLMSKCLSS